jgi:carbamoyl-phosphate synthase large subunit
MNIVKAIKPKGIIVQFGGQTPLNLASGLHQAGAPLIGTSVESIDRAEDRELFNAMIRKLGLHQPDSGMARDAAEAFAVARRIGYPVLVRPSYVLGGRAMEIVYDDAALEHYMQTAVQVTPDRPILVDRFLEDAIEVDVDCIADGRTVVVAGIMEHIEEAGIHSGDSTCVLPPHTLGAELVDEIRRATQAMARELHVVGLMNVQYAVKGDRVYVLEVNPRASRTVPFVSKAIGVPLAKLAAKVMCGMTLEELGFVEEVVPPYYSVKAPVFPFNKFPGVDITLSPEMRSTGEVMGIDADLGHAFVKAYLAAGLKLPKRGRVFLSVKNSDKRAVVSEARTLASLGYELVATDGTWRALKAAGIPVSRVNKVHEGRPHIVDTIKNREIDLVLNTPYGKQQRIDDSAIRAAAVTAGVPCVTTLAGISAVVSALSALHRADWSVRSVQEHLASHPGNALRVPPSRAEPKTVRARWRGPADGTRRDRARRPDVPSAAFDEGQQRFRRQLGDSPVSLRRGMDPVLRQEGLVHRPGSQLAARVDQARSSISRGSLHREAVAGEDGLARLEVRSPRHGDHHRLGPDGAHRGA